LIALALLFFSAELFRMNCSVPYCHGPAGSAGRAPAIAAKAFTRESLRQIIHDGKRPGMPAFAKVLKDAEIGSIVAYVLSLGGGKAPAASKPRNPRPAHAVRGRALFFDAVRMGGCGRCHELDGLGTAVGPSLRDRSKAQIVTARVAGESPFPAVVVQRSGDNVRIYDLGSPLPVLRSFSPGEVTLEPGAKWNHAAATSKYSRAEMDAINAYLEWLRTQR
jgi:mono/diheme cytochrome c family protein